MSSNMGSKWTLTAGVIIVTFLAATKQTNGQIYLLNYSEEKINAARLAEKHFELYNDTEITEVYAINASRIPSELSQSTMDAITIVWYVSTFFALVAFFSLMACSDRKCGRRNIPQSQDEQLSAPPSPAPSYSKFAPPSYETVFKQPYTSSTAPTVFVVQVPYNSTSMDGEKDKDTLSPPPFTFHTVNELQKISL